MSLSWKKDYVGVQLYSSAKLVRLLILFSVARLEQEVRELKTDRPGTIIMQGRFRRGGALRGSRNSTVDRYQQHSNL